MPRRWRAGLRQLQGVTVQEPETNLVFFDINATGVDFDVFVGKLRAQGIMISGLGGRVRACTHLGRHGADDRRGAGGDPGGACSRLTSAAPAARPAPAGTARRAEIEAVQMPEPRSALVPAASPRPARGLRAQAAGVAAEALAEAALTGLDHPWPPLPHPGGRARPHRRARRACSPSSRSRPALRCATRRFALQPRQRAQAGRRRPSAGSPRQPRPRCARGCGSTSCWSPPTAPSAASPTPSGSGD